MRALLTRTLVFCLFSGTASAVFALPGVGWVPNGGQWHSDVAFQIGTSSGSTLLLHNGELVHRTADGTVLRERISGFDAAAGPIAKGREPGTARINAFRGADSKRWSSDLPTWHRLRLDAVVPGVDMELHRRDGALERTLIVHPGGKLSALWFESSVPPHLASSGEIELPRRHR